MLRILLAVPASPTDTRRVFRPAMKSNTSHSASMCQITCLHVFIWVL
jgi:hypothetical protein